jgi:hypothetical protein
MHSFLAQFFRRLSTNLEKRKRRKRDKPLIESGCIVSYQAELHSVISAGRNRVRIKRLDSDLTFTTSCDKVEVVDYPYYR